jgi:hypothetical protein
VGRWEPFGPLKTLWNTEKQLRTLFINGKASGKVKNNGGTVHSIENAGQLRGTLRNPVESF